MKKYEDFVDVREQLSLEEKFILDACQLGDYQAKVDALALCKTWSAAVEDIKERLKLFIGKANWLMESYTMRKFMLSCLTAVNYLNAVGDSSVDNYYLEQWFSTFFTSGFL